MPKRDVRRDPMSESISAIQKVGYDLVGKPVETANQENARTAAAAETKATDTAKAAELQAAKAQDVAQQAKSRTDLPLKEMTDVSLKYRVDAETKELTVLVIDKSSHKVIRTIPSEELKKFREGDLLELTS
jgi:uncharacterized FlaG/YvyC family protein